MITDPDSFVSTLCVVLQKYPVAAIGTLPELIQRAEALWGLSSRMVQWDLTYEFK